MLSTNSSGSDNNNGTFEGMIDMKYRKKPVEIEAFWYDGDLTVCPVWLNEAIYEEIVFFQNDTMYIRTLEGIMKVSKGDFIIQGVSGELYPCKPNIFRATYERVEDGE